MRTYENEKREPHKGRPEELEAARISNSRDSESMKLSSPRFGRRGASPMSPMH